MNFIRLWGDKCHQQWWFINSFSLKLGTELKTKFLSQQWKKPLRMHIKCIPVARIYKWWSITAAVCIECLVINYAYACENLLVSDRFPVNAKFTIKDNDVREIITESTCFKQQNDLTWPAKWKKLLCMTDILQWIIRCFNFYYVNKTICDFLFSLLRSEKNYAIIMQFYTCRANLTIKNIAT